MNKTTICGKALPILGLALTFCLLAGMAWAQAPQLTPPPEPAVRPIVSAPSSDLDQSRIDDRLETAISRAKTALARTESTESEKQAAQKALAAQTPIELVFDKQITQKQIDDFLSAGGKIDRIFQAVSYGWTGSVALKTVESLPKLMGPSLLGVAQSNKTEVHMDLAAQTGRVRPMVWDAGVDGDRIGSASITVAILDTGVDGSHADLAGREVYWKDWTADNSPTSQDIGHHGSHVAGIAVGSGVSSGTDPSTVSFMDVGKFPDTIGYFLLNPFYLPAEATSFNWTSDMRWDTSGTVTEASLGHLNFNNTGGAVFLGVNDAASSPMIFSSTGVANPPAADRSRRYNSFASKAAGTGTVEFAVANTVSYASPGDGYATFRGVAPDCNWAGLKVFPDSGAAGSSLDFGEALDDIVAQKATYGIKVANMSLGIVGDPGIDLTVRNKVNTAALNGIVMVVSAGNDGTKGTGAIAEIDDPGRAHYAITVAAAADDNQLTDYSSPGVVASGVEGTGDNDMKPDILAPGGSSHESHIMSVDSNNGDSEDTSGANFADAVPDNYLNIKGTSMASPYLAGCAALVIDALQQSGQTWNYTLADVLNVKKILLMTATETNQVREATPSQDPTLDRGGKDINEGYGMVNADAAIQAVLSPAYVPGTTVTQSFGANPADRRCWASPFQISSATPIDLKLSAPVGAIFDIYVYSATPDLHGNPVLIQSATGADGNKSLTFAPASDEDAYLVVKRISGAGAWTLGESFELDVDDWRMY
jgi:hypothetical protein